MTSAQANAPMRFLNMVILDMTTGNVVCRGWRGGTNARDCREARSVHRCFNAALLGLHAHRDLDLRLRRLGDLVAAGLGPACRAVDRSAMARRRRSTGAARALCRHGRTLVPGLARD